MLVSAIVRYVIEVKIFYSLIFKGKFVIFVFRRHKECKCFLTISC